MTIAAGRASTPPRGSTYSGGSRANTTTVMLGVRGGIQEATTVRKTSRGEKPAGHGRSASEASRHPQKKVGEPRNTKVSQSGASRNWLEPLVALRRRTGAAAESACLPKQRHVTLRRGVFVTCGLLAYKQLISARETTFKSYMLNQPEPFIPFRDWIRRHPKISPYYIRAVCIFVSFLYGSKEENRRWRPGLEFILESISENTSSLYAGIGSAERHRFVIRCNPR